MCLENSSLTNRVYFSLPRNSTGFGPDQFTNSLLGFFSTRGLVEFLMGAYPAALATVETPSSITHLSCNLGKFFLETMTIGAVEGVDGGGESGSNARAARSDYGVGNFYGRTIAYPRLLPYTHAKLTRPTPIDNHTQSPEGSSVMNGSHCSQSGIPGPSHAITLVSCRVGHNLGLYSFLRTRDTERSGSSPLFVIPSSTFRT